MSGFRKATRRRVWLKVALAGPSGSGKTASSLLMAYGIAGDWSKIGLIDTENGSGELYVGATIGDTHIGEYNVLTLTPPYTAEKYTAAIREAEKAGLTVLIIDSLSHAWAGDGGLLDQHGKIADRSGNSWAAWRNVTPLHNQLVEAMLQSNLHLIATMRSKTEYTQVEEDGKKRVKRLGMAPIQRDGMEYEFTVFLDLDANNNAQASKDRTNLFQGQVFRITPETGKALLAWRDAGVDAPPPVPFRPEPTQPTALVAQAQPSEMDLARQELAAVVKEKNIPWERVQQLAGKPSKDMTLDEIRNLIATLRGEEAA